MFDEPSSYTDMLLLQNISQEIAAVIGNETKIVTLGNQAALLASAQTTFKKAAWSGIGAFTPNMEVYAAIAGEPEDPTSAAERTAFDLWRQEGKEAWWYSSGMLMGNFSNGFQLGVPAIRSRLKMGHLSWKYQVDGFIYYQLFAWEPYCEEPWRSCTAVGTTPTLELTDFMNDRQTWDGEGQLAVPGPDGVLATLHLESVRDGCEYSNGLSPLFSSDADRCCHQTKITSCTGCRTSCAAHPPPATCRLPSQGRCRTACERTSKIVMLSRFACCPSR